MNAIHRARAEDLPAITALLAGAALPTTDIGASRIDFWVDEAADGVIAVIGLERHGDAGLLRSLVVAPAHRGSGRAQRLVEAVEAAARGHGLRELVLLTQTAEAFFARAGYAVIPRGEAPSALQESAEFRALCPASATCMHKPLDGATA